MRCQRQAQFAKSSFDHEEPWQCLYSADNRTCCIIDCFHFRNTHSIQKEELEILK